MKARIWSCVLCLMAGGASLAAHAADAYTGSVPVASRSDADRAGALRKAFGVVLTRISGDAGVLSRPDVAAAVARAERYLQASDYQPNPDAGAPGKPALPLLLVARFDAARVDALLAAPAATAAVEPVDGTVAPPAAPADEGAVPPAGDGGSFRLWIAAIHSAEDYARLIGALSNNPEVRALHVEMARGDALQVRVDARGDLRSLLDALETTRLAHVVDDGPLGEGVDARLDLGP